MMWPCGVLQDAPHFSNLRSLRVVYISPANISDCGCTKGVAGLSFIDPRSGEFDYVAGAWNSAAKCASTLYDTYLAAYCTKRSEADSWTNFFDPTNFFKNSIECPPGHYVPYAKFREAFNCYQNLAIKGTLPEPSKKYSVDGNWLRKVVPAVADCAGITENAAAAIFITFNKDVAIIPYGPQFLWPKTYGSLDSARQEAENSGSIGTWINNNLLKPIGDKVDSTLTTIKWVAIGAAILGGVYLAAVALDKAPSPKTVKERFS